MNSTSVPRAFYGTRPTTSRCALQPMTDGSVSSARATERSVRLPSGSLQRASKSRQHPPRPFDAVERLDREARGRNLGPQLVGAVEERGREVVRVAGRIPMLPLREIALDDRSEARIREQVAGETVERGRPPRDPRGDEDATGLQHARRLGERTATVAGVDEVVEGTEQKDQRRRRLRHRERTGVCHLAGGQTARGAARPAAPLLDQSRRGVDQVHAVPALREPQRVRSRRPADVDHVVRRRRCMTLDQLAGARPLELKRAALEPRLLRRARVEVRDRGVERHSSGISASTSCARSVSDSCQPR